MKVTRTLQLLGLALLIVAIGTFIRLAWQEGSRSPLSDNVAAVAPTNSTVAQPLSQIPSQTPQPGGRFVEAIGEDIESINPIFATDAASLHVIHKLFPPLIGQDPATGNASTTGIAESWSFEAEGRTLRLTLGANLKWSDGHPLTAQDALFTYTLVRDPRVDSPYRANFANVETIETPDERTVVVQMALPDCTILQTLRQPLLPAHAYDNRVEQFLAANPEHPLTISAGPFTYSDRRAGRIILKRNPFYRLGAPLLDRWEIVVVDESEEQLTLLHGYQLDLVALAATQFNDYEPPATIVRHDALLDSLTFLALNLAHPSNPQPGRNADGELLPQSPHPILGTLQIRQALAHGLDYTTLLNTVYGPRAQRLTSYLLPTSWAYNDQLEPYPYDPTRAMQLLTDAGWIDLDGDSIRERDGMPLQLKLLTNSDSESRVQLGQLIQPQLAAIGIDLQFEPVSFDALTAELLAQRYDLVLIGWDNLGAEPANSDFWLSRQDLPGSGANFVSYQNALVDQWLDEARTDPDCDAGYRASRYQRVQAQIHADLPYLVIGGQRQGWAYRREWQNISPQPWRFDHNSHRWWQAEGGN